MNEISLSSVLREFARTLVTDFPIQDILEHLVEQIVGVLPVTSAGVTLIGENRQPRYLAASNASALRYERLQTSLGQGPCVAAFDTGQPVALADLTHEPRFPAFTTAARAAGLGAVFTFPLHHGQHRLGALDLYRETPGDLDEPTMDAAQILADVAAAYLINAQARDDAQAASDQHRHAALHDALTGLPNRTLLHDRLEHAAQRALRTHEHIAAVFIDLDGFKHVNDTHGHHTGDQLLAAVAHRLTTLVRPDDTLARISGDEFVLLCENLTHPYHADLLAHRIHTSFKQPFELADLHLTLTASVGVATTGPGQPITNQLLIDADTAMYHAKQQQARNARLVDRDPYDLARRPRRPARSALATTSSGSSATPSGPAQAGRSPALVTAQAASQEQR